MKKSVTCSVSNTNEVLTISVIASDIVKKKLEIKELGQSGVQVQGCTIKICKSVQELISALMEGNRCKARGETLMNRDSSRSHCIFTIFVETAVPATGVS